MLKEEVQKSFKELKFFDRALVEVIHIFKRRYEDKVHDDRIEDLHQLTLSALHQQQTINEKLLEIIEYLIGHHNDDDDVVVENEKEEEEEK